MKMKRAAKVGGWCRFQDRLDIPLTLYQGDEIVVVVQRQRQFGDTISVSAAQKVRRGDIRHAVVVRQAKKYQRPDGSVVKFDDNACVLINKAREPIGSRLNGTGPPQATQGMER